MPAMALHSEQTKSAINDYMARVEEELREARARSPADEWWWQHHGQRWNETLMIGERARLETHNFLFPGDFLPESKIPVFGRGRPKPTRHSGGIFQPFDYWEADFPCADEARLPRGRVGDGPKWLCGASLHANPCHVVSLGSDFDDKFERAMFAAAGCSSYIVDPTLSVGGMVLSGHEKGRAAAFRAHLATYGADLNETVGIGTSGERMRLGNTHSVPLVSIRTLLEDRFGSAASSGPISLAVLKADIEGGEYSAFDSLWEMCAEGRLAIDQLSLEVHLLVINMTDRHSFGGMHAIFAGARKCGLMLHHKEVNTWGKFPCSEFSWVSRRHAMRVAAHARMMNGHGRHQLMKTS